MSKIVYYKLKVNDNRPTQTKLELNFLCASAFMTPVSSKGAL